MRKSVFSQFLLFVVGVLMNMFVGASIAPFLEISPDLGAASFVAIGVMAGFIKSFGSNTATPSAAFAGLFMETWVKAIKDNLFYGSTLFMSRMMDYSSEVRFNTLNFAELGTTPEVYVNATGAIGTDDNTDINHTVTLEIYDTKNTAITNARSVERSYDQVQAYTAKHRNVLAQKMAKNAIFEFAPTANTPDTPLFATTGAAFGVNNHKRLAIADIINLQKAFNERDYPADGRILVLHPNHVADICNEDTNLHKTFADINKGTVPSNLYGFEVYMSTLTPRYDGSLATKVPTDAAPPTAASVSSVAYLMDESCKAAGEFQMFYRPAGIDVELRKETIGFQARFVAKPIRGIGFAALVSLA